MKSKHTLLWAACIAAAGITAGCCCQADETAKKEQTQVKPSVDKPMKAVTPDGTVVWIVAVWDADPVPCNAKDSPCKTAKCWQTKDGKVLCVKPLKDCPMWKNCNGKKFKCPKTGKVMTTADTPAEAKNCKTHAAKVVKHCPKNGSAKCGAAEHVNMPQGKTGCAAKADQQQQASAQSGTSVPMNDSIVEDTFFQITAVD